MKKKSLIVLLVLSLMVSTFIIGCSPDDEEPDTAPPVEDENGEDEDTGESTAPEEPTGEITIGNSTELTGDWVPYWTNNAADYDVYNFIQGMSTVAMTPEGEYLMNETVLEDHQVEENEDGSKTYTFTIKDGLMYADGTEITATDYR